MTLRDPAGFSCCEGASCGLTGFLLSTTWLYFLKADRKKGNRLGIVGIFTYTSGSYRDCGDSYQELQDEIVEKLLHGGP